MKKDDGWKAIYESLLSDFSNIGDKITSIIGFSDVLMEDLPDDPEIRKHLEIVIKESNDIGLLLQSIKNGRDADFPSESTKIDISLMVDERIDELMPYMESKKVEIENNVPTETYVRMAENHAGSIVGNLLRNSVFHREEGEKILVYSEDPGKEQVFFHNKDLVPGNGVKEKREGTKAATDGNVIIPQKEYGLGIYIVGKIARLYGGELKISEGRGYRDSVVTLPKP